SAVPCTAASAKQFAPAAEAVALVAPPTGTCSAPVSMFNRMYLSWPPPGGGLQVIVAAVDWFSLNEKFCGAPEGVWNPRLAQSASDLCPGGVVPCGSRR